MVAAVLLPCSPVDELELSAERVRTKKRVGRRISDSFQVKSN